MIVADKEVEHCIIRAACHALDNLIGNGRDSGVVNGDCIEGLKVVDDTIGAILLLDAEPTGMV